MNNRGIFRALFVLAVLAWVSCAGAQVTIHEALQEGVVTLRFSGRDASSGDAVEMAVSRTDRAGDAELALTVPPEGWVATEPSRTAAGNQLFTVINGGAEMYLRLGFTRAVFAAYRSPDDRNINLEIYQMENAAAARKVQAMKAGAEGRAADFGETARLADYYLNFCKGPYQVTVSGYDTDKQTVAGILALAGRIDKRLAVP